MKPNDNTKQAPPISRETIRQFHQELPPGSYDRADLVARTSRYFGVAGRSPAYGFASAYRKTAPDWTEVGKTWVKHADATTEDVLPTFSPVDEEPMPVWPEPPFNPLREKLEYLATKHRDQFERRTGEMASFPGLTISLPFLEDAIPEGFCARFSIKHGETRVELGHFGLGSA